MNRNRMWLGCIVVALALVPALAVAGDPPGQQQGMDPMMAAMIEASTPGAQHAKLVELCGEYDITATMMTGPGGEPQTAAGTSSFESIYDGRYVLEKVTIGEGMMLMEGMGFTGYDNTKGEFFSTWIDKMSTGIMLLTGDLDDEGRMVMSGSYQDPLSGDEILVRIVNTYESADKHVMDYYETRGAGPEVRTMDIVYERR